MNCAVGEGNQSRNIEDYCKTTAPTGGSSFSSGQSQSPVMYFICKFVGKFQILGPKINDLFDTSITNYITGICH